MIKIINGTYGYRNSDGRVEAKTPKSKPFSLSEEREAELVDAGVAEYVNGAPATSEDNRDKVNSCLLYTSPSPRDISGSRMPSSA